MPGHIVGPYALDNPAGSQMLTYYSPRRLTPTVVESDRCEQKVNKHQLTKSAAYFSFKNVRNAWKHVICVR